MKWSTPSSENGHTPAQPSDTSGRLLPLYPGRPLSRAVRMSVVVEGAHETIVSREDFELAQSVIHNMTKGESKCRMYPLRSLIRCGDCGRVMSHNRNSTFYCQYGIYQNHGKCDSSMRYREADLEEIAFHAIQLLIQLVDERKKKDISFDSKNAKARQQK